VAISDMPEEGMQRVFEVASQSDLKVYQWQADLTLLESPLGESP